MNNPLLLPCKDQEKRYICPYNPAHILLHYRMQTHLVKCRRQHPKSKYVSCPYNSTHSVPEPELSYHLETCSSRDVADSFLYVPENINADRFAVPKIEIPCSENWDDIEERPTYNPEEYCANNLILRNDAKTKSAAQRKAFRNDERNRFQELQQHHVNLLDTQETQSNEITSKPRHPTVASGALQTNTVIDEDDESHVSALLAKIELGSKVLTTPKWTPVTNPPAAENIGYDINDFPQLGVRNSNNKSKGKGHGRGSRFSQK